MKDRIQAPRLKEAFTLIELLAVIGILCLLASFMLPVLARAKIKSPDAGCLSNLRQMQLGWSMYRDDNNDYMMPNAPYSFPDALTWCGTKQMGWQALNINTNQAYFESSLMAPYVGNQIGIYRCPADTIPSANGQRIRSYSMNGQMGMVYFQGQTTGVAAEDSGAKIYVKASDVIAPTPSSAIVFADESTYTLLGAYGDGYLQIATLAANAGFPDAPSARHGGGCGLSYVDGHAEVHKWQTTMLTSLPTAYGQTVPLGSWAVPPGSAANNVDWIWWSQHTAAKANGQIGP